MSSSEEEDVDFAPTNNFSDDGSQVSETSSSTNSIDSESDAEFTDDEGKVKVKSTAKKRRSKQTRKPEPVARKSSRFLDTEALVGDETDDEEESEDGFMEDFIAGSDEEEEAAAAAAESRRSQLGRPSSHTHDEEFDAEAEERRIKALYGRVRDSSVASKAASMSTSASVPRPFLLPTVTDPKLWLCKAQQGRERSASLALLRVVMERQFSGQPLQIFSIIARDGLKGYVYIEAHKPTQVAQAIEIAKLNHCLYPGQAGKSLVLVPMAEMPQVLQTTAASSSSASSAAAEIPEIGAWVRVKRGRYSNDLAQVVDNAQDEGSYDPSNLNTCIIRLKLLPRLAFSGVSAGKDRAPPRVFDPEEASKHGPVSKSRGFWIFGGETYRDGFLHKNIRLSSLIVSAVTPTAEEMARFPDADRSSSFDGFGSQSSTASSAQLADISISLAPKDQVIIIEGEMKNLEASVDFLEWRPSASTGRPEQYAHLLADSSTGLQGDAAHFVVKVTQLRKLFAVGAQVRIISGQHANEVGIVVAVEPGSKNVVIFASGSNQQFSVPAGICALAQGNSAVPEQVKLAAVKTSRANAARSNDYSLDDLVQFEVEIGGEEGIGVVIRILDTENSVAVFDSLGQIRTIPCRSVSLVANYNEMAANNNNFAAQTGDLSVKQGDRVIEKNSGAFYKTLHIYKTLAFVRPLSGAIPSGSAAISVLPLGNVSKPRPVPTLRPNAATGPVGHLIGKNVTITGGPQKGYVGFVKQIADNIARVELHTNGKIINIAVDKLALVSNGKHEASSNNRDSRNREPSGSAVHTPAWNASAARTPAWNAYSGAKTPGWNASSARTPGWNPATSSRTPAWNAASSARTPAWNPSTTPGHAASGAKTPAWSATTGTTPAWSVPTAVSQSSTAANWQKGTTPAWNSSSSRTPAWSSATNSSNSNQDETAAKKKDEKQPWEQVNNWKND